MNPKAFIKGWNELNRDLRLLTVSLFFWGLGATLWGPLFSIHLSDLGASPRQIGLVFTIASLLVTVSSIPGGILADKFDRKKNMIAFWLIGSLSAPILAFADSWIMAIPGALFYYASIIGSPAINAYVTDCSSENNLSTAFGVIYATAPISLLIGPPIGGQIADLYGIRTLFMISFGIYLISTAILLLLSSQKPPRKDTPIRQSFGFLRDKQFLILCGIAAFVYVYFYAINPFVTLYMAEVYGLDFSTIGILSAFAAVGGTILVLLFGRIGDKWDRIWAYALAIGIYGISATLIGAFSALPILAVGFFLRGSRDIGDSMTHSIVASLGREKMAGLYFGAFGIIVGLGQSAAPQVGAWLYDNFPNDAFEIFGVFGITLAIIVALPGRRIFNHFSKATTETEVIGTELQPDVATAELQPDVATSE